MNTFWIWLRVVALSAAGMWLHSGCETTAPGHLMTVQEAIQAQQKIDAVNDAEVPIPTARQKAMLALNNATEPSREDAKRMAGYLAAQSAREQHMVAEQARFQFEQKLELAQASGSRNSMYAGEGQSGETLGQAYAERHGETIAIGGHVAGHQRGQESSGGAINAPDRYYLQSTLEQSANQLVSDSARREQEANANANNANNENPAPFADPVPGMPGYVTSPEPIRTGGYIDVRGYNPGTTLIDPYTGQYMRVP